MIKNIYSCISCQIALCPIPTFHYKTLHFLHSISGIKHIFLSIPPKSYPNIGSCTRTNSSHHFHHDLETLVSSELAYSPLYFLQLTNTTSSRERCVVSSVEWNGVGQKCGMEKQRCMQYSTPYQQYHCRYTHTTRPETHFHLYLPTFQHC